MQSLTAPTLLLRTNRHRRSHLRGIRYPSDALLTGLELPRLRSLLVEGFSIGGPTGLGTAALPSLTKLVFRGNHCSDDAAAVLAAAPWYAGLKKLELVFGIDGSISDFAQCRLLSAPFDGLSHLKLGGDFLGTALLAKVAGLPSLESLSLDFRYLTDLGGWGALAAAPMPRLKEVELSCEELPLGSGRRSSVRRGARS